MKLSELDIAKIICGNQENCIHRSNGGDGGECGDCLCPAKIIFAIETNGPMDGEDMETALYGNRFAKNTIRHETNR